MRTPEDSCAAESADKLSICQEELFSLSSKALAKLLPGRRLQCVRPLSEGRINSIYSLRLSDPDQTLVLRLRTIKNYNYEKGIIKDKSVTDMLSDRVRTPHVYAEDASRETFPCEATFLEYVEGENLAAREMSVEEARECGSTLAEIHKTRLESFRTWDKAPQEGVTDWRGYYGRKIDANLDDLRDIDPSLAEKMRVFFLENLHYIPDDTPPTLVHHDYHAGNLIKTPAGEICVIDWDASSIAVAGIDLIKIRHLNFRNSPERYRHFLSGYRAARGGDAAPITYPALRVYEALWLLRAMGFESTHANPDPAYFPGVDYYRRTLTRIADESEPGTLLRSMRNGFQRSISSLPIS